MRVLKPCRQYCETAMEYGENSPITMLVCEDCPWSKEMKKYEDWKNRKRLVKSRHSIALSKKQNGGQK